MRGVTGLFDDHARTEADVARHEAEYARQIDRLAAERLEANVGLKLTHLGIHVDPELMYAATGRLLERAAGHGMRLRFDMEESDLVPATLALYRRLRAAGRDNIGIVLQSYLRRSEDDLADLLPLGLNVRIVKGAYLEPAAVAYPDKRDVDAAYVRMVERCLEGAEFTAIATHDAAIVATAQAALRRRAVAPERFEFQMLYGIASGFQRRIVERRLPTAHRRALRADLVRLPDAAPGRASGQSRVLRQARLHAVMSAPGCVTIPTPAITTTRPTVVRVLGRLPSSASMTTATAGTRKVQAKTRALVHRARAR